MTALVIDGATRWSRSSAIRSHQLESPADVTRALQQRGRNVHVTADDVDTFIDAAQRVQNIDGIIVTVPPPNRGANPARVRFPAA